MADENDPDRPEDDAPSQPLEPGASPSQSEAEEGVPDGARADRTPDQDLHRGDDPAVSAPIADDVFDTAEVDVPESAEENLARTAAEPEALAVEPTAELDPAHEINVSADAEPEPIGVDAPIENVEEQTTDHEVVEHSHVAAMATPAGASTGEFDAAADPEPIIEEAPTEAEFNTAPSAVEADLAATQFADTHGVAEHHEGGAHDTPIPVANEVEAEPTDLSPVTMDARETAALDEPDVVETLFEETAGELVSDARIDAPASVDESTEAPATLAAVTQDQPPQADEIESVEPQHAESASVEMADPPPSAPEEATFHPPEETVEETIFVETTADIAPSAAPEAISEAPTETHQEAQSETPSTLDIEGAELTAPEAPALADAANEATPLADEAVASASDSAAALPPGFFKAAGDPDEPPDEPDRTLTTRLREATASLASRARAFAEPRWVAFSGASRAFFTGAWRQARDIKRPRNIREAAVWSGWAAGAGVALVVGFFFFVTWDMPSTDDLWEARGGQSITFLDRNGHVILREGAQNAPPVDLASLPAYVGQAFIAIEDKKFYQHFGVDVGGMLRAGAENLRAGRVVQGGSTITQQLAKNLFLTNERSWRRKAQEVAMAIWLETKFTKDEILALYLSRVYFGAGAYGVEAAAERYFDRPARELTLLQSAMLAGLVKAPSRLNPARQDIEGARARAGIVLAEMVNMGFISDAERRAALQEELVISRRNPAGVLSYYRDWIDPLLNEVIGTDRGDFVIETTIDVAAQRAGAEAIEQVLAEQGEARRVSQAALLALDDSGGVRAMVGGRDYDVSQFNRATQARRQPGSSFKFFIYLTAMENGLTPWSVREDAPITVHIEGQPDWSPGNYTNEYHGPTELARAFSQSFNMVAIRVANEVGGDNVIATAQRLGVRSPLHNYHSLALGAQEITLMEMTQAYGAMAAEGYNIEPHGVVRIRRGNDNETTWSWRQANRQRVIYERPLRYMNYMMNRVVESGTGTHARIPGRQIGGKTGTGNDYRDAWFVGFTPGFVAGVWVGNDNFTETARVTGGSLPADIWQRFMTVALRNTPARSMQMPGPEDYDIGLPPPRTPSMAAVGAPVGATLGGATAPAPPDDEDRSLDFGPEG